MNKLYKNHQSIIILFLLITLILVLMFAPYWINNVPFTYGTDVKTQWYQYFTEFKHLIRNFLVNKELPFYSWSTFLGSNFYASRSYYLVGDIYAYISLLFRTNFFTAYMIQTILKFYVSGFTFYYLLTVFNYKPYVRIIGSLSYAFSGWAIFYSGQLSFLSFYSFLPLYFVGIELYLRHQKKLLFTFSCALLLFTNFYFFYTVSFFTPLYFTYRYFLLKPNMRFFIKDTLLLILFYFIGIMITGVLTLPTVFYLINSNRLSFVGLMLSYPYPKLYFHQLVSALVPNYLYLYKNNIFEIDWHVVREICLYSGSATVVFLSQVFFDKNKKFKIASIVLYIVLIMIMVCPTANSAMHGFADPSLRWLFLFAMVNILIASEYLNRINEINKRNVVFVSLVLAIICITIVPITGFITEHNFDINNFVNQFYLFALFAILYLIYALIFAFSPRKIIGSIVLIIVLELGLSSWYLSQKEIEKSYFSWDFIYRASSVLENNRGDFNRYLDSLDEENSNLYYRVYVDINSVYWDFSPNMSQVYNINGVITYDSTYSPSFNDTSALVDVSYYGSPWIFYIRDSVLLDYLNVKYLIVTESSQLPSGGEYFKIDDYYGFQVYENLNYRKLGTSYSKILTYNDLKNIHNNNLSLLDQTLVVNDKDFYEVSKLLTNNDNATLNNITYGGNKLVGYTDSEDDSFILVTLPFDSSWNVFVNGARVKTYQVNGGYIGFPIKSGNSTIEMYFIPTGIKLGFVLSILGLSGFVILFMVETNQSKKKK